jgi:sulfoacetaldehyde acetyltransferase
MEQKNQVSFYNRRFVGSDIEVPLFSEVARAMGDDGGRADYPAT